MLCSSVSVPYLMSNCFNAEQEQGREHDGNACDRNLMSATFNEGEHPHPSPLTPSALVLERLGPQGPLSLSLSPASCATAEISTARLVSAPCQKHTRAPRPLRRSHGNWD